ncbi:MAG: hypothetical protein AMXMBFR4_16200 [Candidatus Hydrogenedentota bacterium]
MFWSLKVRCPALRSNSGFTLAELLVASTVLAILLGAVYTAFTSSVNLWKLGEANIHTYQDARTSLSMITTELQNMAAGASHLFVGDNEEFEFYAVTTPMNVEDGTHPRVLWIRYRLKSDPRGEGRILLREERPVESALPSGPPEDGGIDDPIIQLGRESEFELATGVKDFELRYYWLPPSEPGAPASGQAAPGQASFIVRDEHPKKSGIPQAIKIELTLIDPNAESGLTTFATYAVFRGPTTRLDKDSFSTETFSL